MAIIIVRKSSKNNWQKIMKITFCHKRVKNGPLSVCWKPPVKGEIFVLNKKKSANKWEWWNTVKWMKCYMSSGNSTQHTHFATGCCTRTRALRHSGTRTFNIYTKKKKKENRQMSNVTFRPHYSFFFFLFSLHAVKSILR